MSVKARIDLDKSSAREGDFIQGYCDRGMRPKLNLKSAPLKQSIGGERKIMGQGEVTSHVFTMRGSLVTFSELPTNFRLLFSYQN